MSYETEATKGVVRALVEWAGPMFALGLVGALVFHNIPGALAGAALGAALSWGMEGK